MTNVGCLVILDTSLSTPIIREAGPALPSEAPCTPDSYPTTETFLTMGLQPCNDLHPTTKYLLVVVGTAGGAPACVPAPAPHLLPLLAVVCGEEKDLRLGGTFLVREGFTEPPLLRWGGAGTWLFHTDHSPASRPCLC